MSMHTIYVCSDVEWSSFNRRELFIALARIMNVKIIVVDRPSCIFPNILRPSKWRGFIKSCLLRVRQDDGGITIVRPITLMHEHLLARIWGGRALKINTLFVSIYLRLCDLGPGKNSNVTLWAYEQPQWWFFGIFGNDGLNIKKVWEVFDDYRMMADGTERKLWIKQHPRMVAEKAITFFLTRSLRAKYNSPPSSFVIGNGYDRRAFDLALQDNPDRSEDGMDSRRPIALYIGVIRDWIDFSLLFETVRGLPGIDFVFAGPITPQVKSVFQSLLSESNVRYIGVLSRGEVAATMARADVGIIPYIRTRFTESVRPIKMIEFLAAGTPVVTTVGDDYESYSGAIIKCAGVSFSESITKMINERNRDACRKIAADSSWDSIARYKVAPVLGISEKHGAL